MFREARMFWRMEMFRRINLFRTFLGPVSTLEKRAGPVSIKEINWPFSPPRTNAPTNPVSPRGTLACFFKQEDFILAGQQDFPLHPPGFLTAHQNYFLLAIRRIVSGKRVDFFHQPTEEMILPPAAAYWQLRGSDGNPMGSFNWRQSGSDLDTLNARQTFRIDRRARFKNRSAGNGSTWGSIWFRDICRCAAISLQPGGRSVIDPHAAPQSHFWIINRAGIYQ